MFLTFSHLKAVDSPCEITECLLPLLYPESSGLLTFMILIPVGLLGRIHGKSESLRDQKGTSSLIPLSYMCDCPRDSFSWGFCKLWFYFSQKQSRIRVCLLLLCWNVKAAVSCRTDLPRLPLACGAPSSPPLLQGTDPFRVWLQDLKYSIILFENPPLRGHSV